MLLGIDAEYVIRDEEGNLISCHELPPKGQYLRGESRPPHGQVPRQPNASSFHGFYGCDGVFLEATSNARYCRIELTAGLWTGLLAGFRAMCAKVGKKRLVMPPTTEAVLTEAEMQALPDEANMVGCVPSLNIYGESRGPVPGSPAGPTRWTGLHIHMSKYGDYPDDLWVRYLDRVVGLSGVVMDPLPDESIRRRLVYGEAGCYRVRDALDRPDPAIGEDGRYIVGPDGKFVLEQKPVRVLEYRVLPGVLGYFWCPIMVLTGIARSCRKHIVEIVNQFDDQTVQRVINESDKTVATEMVQEIADQRWFEPYFVSEFYMQSNLEAEVAKYFTTFLGLAARHDSRPNNLLRRSLWPNDQDSLFQPPLSPTRVTDLASRLYTTTALEYDRWTYRDGGELKREEVTRIEESPGSSQEPAIRLFRR